MPKPTLRTHRAPKSEYQACATLTSCVTATGADYLVNIGRRWNGNQRRERKRFNPPTPCDSTTFKANLETIRQGVCPCATRPAFAPAGPNGPGSGPYGEASANGVNERNLRSRALARFSSNAGLGVTLAETAGTLRSLGDRLNAVARILNALRKGDVRTACSVLYQHTGYNTTRAAARLRADPGRTYADRVSNFWLETVFGWVPLLQSIYDSMEVLGRDYRTDRRSRASDASNGMRAGVVAEFRTNDINRFSKLGIINPAEILWDLVPFSFVLDWFVPIANSIRFLGIRSLTTEMWIWSSRKWGRKTFLSDYQGAPEGTFSSSQENYARTVGRPDVSTFTARLPSTMWHAITSAALIQGLRPR